VIDHDNSADNRVYQEVARVGELMEKIQGVKGGTQPAKVGILYDWENNWALDDAQGFAQKTKRYPQTVQEHYRYFWNHDIPVDVVTPRSDLSQYDLVIAPMLYVLQEADMASLRAYTKAGGYLVSTYLTGIVNESDLTYINGWPATLQEIFGVRVKETDVYYPHDQNAITSKAGTFAVKDYAALLNVQGAEVLARYQSGFYKDEAAVTRHAYGQGQAFFIGPRTNGDYLEQFYGEIVRELALGNPFIVAGNTAVSVQTRYQAGQAFHFVMNFSEEEQTITVVRELQDLLSGEVQEKQLALQPYQVCVLVEKM
jgi:beta-galactosidase